MSDILEQEAEPKYIDVYIQETGDLSRIVKDFELYKGQYIEYYIDIYVPITLSPSTEGHGVGVKTALMYTKRNGALKTTIGYNAVIKEQGVVKYGRTYDVYEQRIPQEYVKHLGEQTLIANIFEIDNSVEPAEFIRIITSQTCPLVIQMSDYIDNEETPDPSQLEQLITEVNTLKREKQDKVPIDPDTHEPALTQNSWQDSENVTGAINNNTAQTETNRQNIATNTGNISTHTTQIGDIQAEQLTQNANIQANTNDINGTAGNPGLKQQVAELQDIVGSGEDYIGTYTNTYDPETQFETLSSALTAYVETLRPSVEGGDVVIYVQQISGGTDRNYKFIYSGTQDEWTYYEIPATEKADNSTYGIVKGSYNPSDTDTKTQVDIVSGEIEDIYVRDNSNTQRHLAEYLNTDSTQVYINRGNIQTNTNNIGTLQGNVSTLQGQMSNVLDGTTSVGKAVKAEQDGNGNNIVNTYLTQTAGVTKVQMREYALPRAFNDVSYLTSTGFSNEIPTSVSPIYTATSEAVGDTTLFTAEKTLVNAEFELCSKNSSTDTIYVSASAICNVQFRLTTEIYVDNAWTTASVDLTDNVQFTTANEIKKVSFGGTFALLSEVYKLSDGDKFRQTLEVVTNVSSSITFNVYSNETYPSTFYLNTTSQTIQVAQGDLGEVLTLELTGTYDNVNDMITFDIPVGFVINDSTLAQFVLTIPTVTAPDEITDTTKVQFTQGQQTLYTMVVPTLADGRTVPIMRDIESAVAGATLMFTGVFEVSNGDIYLYTSITAGGQAPDLSNYVTKDTDQTITGKKTINGTSLGFKHSDNGHELTLEADSDLRGILKMNNTELLRFVGQYGTAVSVALNALNDNSIDLGKAGNRWRDLYLSRNLTDGTNSITIANIANKNDVLIKPLTLSTTTMTDEQIAQLRAYNCVLTNDLVLGTTSLKAGTLLTVPFEYSNSLRGMAIYNNKIMTYYISLTSKQIGDGAQDINISNVANIQTGNVVIGNYTINKDSFGQLQIGNNNATSMQFDGSTVRSNNLVPMGNNSKDLGSSGQKWRDLYLGGDLKDGTNSISINAIVNKADGRIVAPNYDNTATYAVGDIVLYNGSLYKCTTAVATAEDFDNTKWTSIVIADTIEDVEIIKGEIPAQASSSNQLADKAFVNSSIATNTANFIGTFANVTALRAYAGTVTNNDYAFVTNQVLSTDFVDTTALNAVDKTTLTNFDYAWVINGAKFDLYRFDIELQTWELRVQNTAKADVTLNTAYNRYKAIVSGGTTTWLYEYTLNNSSFTANQWASINSGITSADVTQIGTNTSNISNKMDKANPRGTGTVAIGSGVSAYGQNSQAVGIDAEAWGQGSHAEGVASKTGNNGIGAHAEGCSTANGSYSHAEGYYTTAGSQGSHAEGYYTTADLRGSHAEGNHTTASGQESHAEGLYTIAQRASQHVFGEYNTADTTGTTTTHGDYIEIVGNGTADNARSNARTLDWYGNEVLAGGLKINGTDDVITADDVVSTTNVTPLANYYTKAETAKIDLSNVTYPAITAGSITTGSGDRVVETYISSVSSGVYKWYRKWASGWKECGGEITGTSGETTQSFGITFEQRPRIVMSKISVADSRQAGTAYYDHLFGYSLTTSSFKVYRTGDAGGANYHTFYYACGY